MKYGRPPSSCAELVDRHDRGVIEPRLDPRLAQEPLDVAGRGRGVAHALERDLAADPLIAARRSTSPMPPEPSISPSR